MTKTDNLPAKPETNGVALPTEDPFAGFRGMADDFDDGSRRYVEHFGLSLPRIKTDFGKGGEGFVHPDGLTTEGLDVVLLAFPPSRTFWLKGLDETGGGEPPDCKSFDMAAPDPESPHRQAPTCAVCPHSRWTTTDSGERVGPKCEEAVNCFIYDTETKGFAWLRFKRTALKPFRSYVSTLRARSVPFYAVVTEIRLEKHEEGAKKWLVPAFSIGTALTPAEVAPMREVAEGAMASFSQVVDVLAAEDSEPVDGEVVGEPFSDAPFTAEDETL